MIHEPGRPGHHHLELFRDHRVAVTTAALMYAAAVALLTTVAFDQGRELIQPLDDDWHHTMVTVELGALTVVARVFDVIGGSLVTWPLRVGLGVHLALKRRWAAFTTWVVVAVLTQIEVTLLKGFYDRERPVDGLVDASGSAFPSGHATVGAATAVALVVVLLPPGEHRRAWEVRAGLFAFAMALSRTYLRVHWLSDVVAGALLGAATVLAVAAVVQITRTRMRSAAASTSRPPGA